jgi:hypothetical protein
VILLLNPGLGPLDAFAELTNGEFKSALIDNLQSRPVRGGGFMFLDPHFGWHAGFGYWHRKLRRVIEECASRWSLSYVEARNRVKAAVSTVELVPYHSAQFGIPRGIIKNLRSVRLMREFVHDVLLPRSKEGDCLLVVARGARHWGLKPEKNVIVYNGIEAQSAHLTPESQGGAAILRHLAPKAD